MANGLDPDAVRRRLAQHPGWSFDGTALVRSFDRGDFNGSIAFVNAVAAVANRLDHHPDLTLAWNDVTVRTWSHDINAISARDFTLIAAIDAIAS